MQSAPVVPSTPAQPHVHLVAAEHHTHSTVPDQPIHSSVVVPPVLAHTEHTHHTHLTQAAAPASPPAPPVPAEKSRLLVTAGAAVKNRFSLQGGRVSIVGTVVLSVLISSGLYSLQLISKWRRPKATETVTKADSLDQPLTIARDESQTPNERADAAADSSTDVTSKDAHSAQPASHSEDGDQRGLDEFFANSKKEVPSHAAAQAISNSAPYAPEPVNANAASASPADTRTVMAPETAGDRGLPYNQQPAVPSTSPTDSLPGAPPASPNPALATAQYGGVAPSPQISPIYRPSNLPSTMSPAAPVETANASPLNRQLPSVAPGGMNVAPQWNQSASPAAPVASATAAPIAAAPNAPHSLLDAPGPMILPGRSAGTESTSVVGSTPGVVPAAATTDPAAPLRDLSQPTPAIPSQTATAVAEPPAALPSTAMPQSALPQPSAQSPAGVDPVTGLINRRAAASTPDAAHSESVNALAALDRSKVMSFQFRNAPWTVVLSQFAAETHLELRMQVVPQGVFNRWDATRYSPSQTLAILNSEIARAGCQLKLEGSVLRVVALSSSTAQSAAARPATPSSLSLLPRSTGIVPVSGSY